MVEPFRIHLGDQGPVQQSAFTCGSTCLVVARMLVDPGFAQWVAMGDRGGQNLRGRDTENERLATIERIVMARTNSLIGPGRRLQLPWPRRLGTPPWGARQELEHGAAQSGARYEIQWCRLAGEQRLRRYHDELRQRLADGRPAILYVGSRWLPRHVTLVLPAASGQGLDVYDPARGGVDALGVDPFAARRLGVAGWDVPWLMVLPRKHGQAG